MKTDRNKSLILWIITLLPIAITCLALPFLPDQVPMHSDINGTIDRWGSKYENLIFPVIIFLFTLFWSCFLRYFDKKMRKAETDKERKEAKNNKTVIYVAAIGTSLLYCGMQCIFLYADYKSAPSSVTSPIDITMAINLLSGLLLIILGNFLPRTKRNAVVGLRTSWTMKDDHTWAKGNRFAAKAFLLCGILTIAETLFLKGWASVAVMLLLLLGAAVASVVYSYLIWIKEPR